MQQQSRWVSLGMSASMVAALVVGGGACQAPDGACADNTDCAFGQTCRAEQCVATLPGRGNGDGSGLRWGSYWSSVPAALRGSIANASVRNGIGDVFIERDATTLSIVDSSRASTFIAVYFEDPAALRTPGRSQYNEWFGTTWAQACNYDTAEYDETFSSLTVEVGEVRPAEPGEVVEVDGSLPAVVDVVVTIDANNTDVVGSAVVPVIL